jgi:hypothetical protein
MSISYRSQRRNDVQDQGTQIEQRNHAAVHGDPCNAIETKVAKAIGETGSAGEEHPKFVNVWFILAR